MIVPATRADIPALSEVLARAFDDDPWTNWFIRQDGQRGPAFRLFYRVCLERFGLPAGESYTTADRIGAALWNPPGTWQIGVWQQILFLPQLVKVVGWRRLYQGLRGINMIAERHPILPHRYLFMLGVDPAHQGKGHGSAFLRPGLERCDRERMPSYLETGTEKNVQLYERFGYRIRSELQIPDGGPKVWLMWREPAV